MLKESESHSSIAIRVHTASNVAGTESGTLENSYYDKEEQRRGMKE